MFDRIFRGALGATLIAALAGCSEQVTGALGCPDLCSDESAILRDTVLTGSVVQDSTLMGFPLFGSTRNLTLVSRGDTADVRAVVRYDTLPRIFTNLGGITDTIRVVDSAHVFFLVDTTGVKPTAAVTVEAFDVDTTADDVNAVVPLFRADRLLGSRVYQPDEINDTLNLPIDNAALLSKIVGNQRLRIGFRVSGAGPTQLRLAGATLVPIVRFRASLDTAVKLDTIVFRSMTPVTDSLLLSTLSFYPVVVSGALPPPPANRLAIGGIAGARSYLRFDIPDIVLDSVEVVRATIELEQLPSRTLGGGGDSITLAALAVFAAPEITDLFILSRLTAASGGPALKLAPRDSGLKALEVAALVRTWKLRGSTTVNRSVFLQALQEGASPGELNFFSTKGPATLRPRLRLTYVPHRGFGLP